MYKKDTKGKIRVAKIETDSGKLSISTGLLDGKKIPHVSTSDPKNIGKANETSSRDQAIAEGLSKVQLKLREGYFLSKEEAEENEVIKPMLAVSITDEMDSIVYPCYIQPKLDGMRALKNKLQFKSRKNSKITTVSHIEKELSTLKYILDGELYAHGYSFQDNMKFIKKTREETLKVCYYVYDIISDKPFSERYNKLKSEVESSNLEFIKLVPTYEVTCEEDFEKYYKIFIDQGYEGAMVRNGTEGYKVNGRSKSLLKYKKFIDRPYKLVDITPAKKNKSHGVPVVRVDDTLLPLTTPKIEWYKEGGSIYSELVDGVECGYPTTRCGCKLSHEEREDLLTNKTKYIGKTAEVRFFEFHDSGVPRFPVFYGLRLDK